MQNHRHLRAKKRAAWERVSRVSPLWHLLRNHLPRRSGTPSSGLAPSRASCGPAWATCGVARAAAAIQDTIRAHLEELGGDRLSDAESWIAAYRAVPQERLVAVGSSHRFMAYETDFGWGGLTRVELVSLFVRQMVTLLGAKDGGVQVSVALDEAAMEAFAASFVVPVSLECPRRPATRWRLRTGSGGGQGLARRCVVPRKKRCRKKSID